MQGALPGLDLPHSDDGFVQAFPAETTEAFCDGHNAAFGYFGGVPRRIVYDNTKRGGADLGDGTRQRTQVFRELHRTIYSPILRAAGEGQRQRQWKGWTYVRRNFFVPRQLGRVERRLSAQCGERRGRRLRRHTETIGERFARDTARRCCRYRRSRTGLRHADDAGHVVVGCLSVPTAYPPGGAGERLRERGVRVRQCGDRPPSAATSGTVLIFEPRHYAEPCWSARRGRSAKRRRWPVWQLPDEFLRLRRLLEARLQREYVQVLRGSKTFARHSAAPPGRVRWSDRVRCRQMRCRLDHRPLDLGSIRLTTRP